jgi:hypothetical protein
MAAVVVGGGGWLRGDSGGGPLFGRHSLGGYTTGIPYYSSAVTSLIHCRMRLCLAGRGGGAVRQ